MERIIKECSIEEQRFENFIYVKYNDGLVECIGRYYSDELSFTESEFIGLTLTEAKALIHERDVAYLRS